MDAATAFALHFARLLSQVLQDPRNADAHRATLESLLEVNRDAIALRWVDWALIVDDTEVPDSMPGVADLNARMAAHGLRVIAFGPATEPGHIMGAAVILAGHPGVADRGAAAFARLMELGATRVHFVTVGGFEAQARRRQTTSLTPDSGGAWGYPMLPETPTSLPVVPTPGLPSSTLPGSRPSQLIAAPPVAPSRATRAGRLIEQLRAASDLGTLGTVLDAVGTFVPMSVSAGDIKDAAALVHAVMELEQVFTTPPGPLRLRMALRHTADAHFLRALAADLPRAREHREVYLAIFARMGDAGVEALVDRLSYAELAKDRRVLFDTIVGFGGGVPTIVRMLNDERWYVVRNAAELLGRLAAAEGEQPLVELLRHREARVRRSAAVALIRIGPATAVTALVAAMRDSSSDVRIHAIQAAGERREQRVVMVVMRALDNEKDDEVRRAIYAALGQMATPEAVNVLISAATDGGGLFRRGVTPVRVAAVRALAEARTPEAIAAITSLTTDRDREVRESASRGLTSRSAAAVSEASKAQSRGW